MTETYDDDLEDTEEQLVPIAWNIERQGRAWTVEEYEPRVNRLIELKFETRNGKLFWSEDTRRMILAMLLENCGMDAAVQMGNLEKWRAAIEAAERDAADTPTKR